MKLKIFFLNLVIALMIGAAFYGVFYYLSLEKENNLKALTTQRVSILAQNAVPALENALAGADKTPVTADATSAIMKIENVKSAFISDTGGNIVASSDNEMAGSVLEGDIYSKALHAQTYALSQVYAPEVILYSQRLSSKYVLFLKVSVEADLAQARQWRVKYATVLFAAWFIIMFISYGLSKALFKPCQKRETEVPYQSETEENYN
jgi:hypothetical protein